MEQQYTVHDITMAEISQFVRSNTPAEEWERVFAALVAAGVDSVEVPETFVEYPFVRNTSKPIGVQIRLTAEKRSPIGRSVNDVPRAFTNVVIPAETFSLQPHHRIESRAEALRGIRETIRAVRGVVNTVQFTTVLDDQTDIIFARQCIETALEVGVERIGVRPGMNFGKPWEGYINYVKEIRRFCGNNVFLSVFLKGSVAWADVLDIGVQQIEISFWERRAVSRGEDRQVEMPTFPNHMWFESPRNRTTAPAIYNVLGDFWAKSHAQRDESVHRYSSHLSESKPWKFLRPTFEVAML